MDDEFTTNELIAYEIVGMLQNELSEDSYKKAHRAIVDVLNRCYPPDEEAVG